jgi:hypothetical protein
MTAQTPRTSLKEAAMQSVVGIPIGLVVSYSVALLHLPPAMSAWLITGLMFLASTVRGFIIRRKFDRFERRLDGLTWEHKQWIKGNEHEQ